MRTLKLTLAYDGTDYAGWQRQQNALAVQQVVEEAFAHFTDGEPPTVAGAGRTDAGVHARGQVASVIVDFDHPVDAVTRGLNVRLPDAIRVLETVDAPLGFHARFHATGKTYAYRITRTPVLSPFDRHYAWHVPWRLDVDAMRAAAEAFVGRHDFASFQASGTLITDTVRTVERCDLAVSGDDLVITVTADGFLRHMVRTMVGTLVDVGSRHRAPETMPDVLAAARRDAAGRTAPAQGLTLIAVRY
jgi:tRNA pseudouridine38-40 synthase